VLLQTIITAAGRRAPDTGSKVFMDAHQPVTLKEGDRYPLGPPSFEIDDSVESLVR
jgi:hypothetical protein